MTDAIAVPVQRVLAGFWIRAAAFTIDFLIVNVTEFAVEYALARLFGLDPLGEQILDGVLSLGFYFYYYGIYQVKHQATPAKRWLGLEIVCNNGQPLRLGRALWRCFGYLLSFVMLGCGFIMVAFHPEKKSFHDLISGTSVAKRRKP